MVSPVKITWHIIQRISNSLSNINIMRIKPKNQRIFRIDQITQDGENAKQIELPQLSSTVSQATIQRDIHMPILQRKNKTDIFIINLIESTAGAPVLWMFSSLFRLWLGDDLELLAYALTISIAAAMHWVVVNHYITAMVVGEE